MQAIDLTQVREFSSQQLVKKIVHDSELMRVVLLCFEDGQFIPPHNVPCDVCLYAMEGEGVVTAGDEKVSLKAGEMIVVPAGKDRGIKANGRYVVLHAVAPRPTPAMHAAANPAKQ